MLILAFTLPAALLHHEGPLLGTFQRTSSSGTSTIILPSPAFPDGCQFPEGSGHFVLASPIVCSPRGLSFPSPLAPAPPVFKLNS